MKSLERSQGNQRQFDVMMRGQTLCVNDVDVGLTPDAAEETSNRLLEGSMKARGQRHLKHYPHRAK